MTFPRSSQENKYRVKVCKSFIHAYDIIGYEHGEGCHGLDLVFTCLQGNFDNTRQAYLDVILYGLTNDKI